MIGREHIARRLYAHPARPQIEEALARGAGMHTMRDVYEYLLADRAQLWSDTRALAITCIHEYPRGKTCVIWLAGGEIEQILAFEPDIIQFARARGCSALELFGRPGWQKALRDKGYRSERFCSKRIDTDG